MVSILICWLDETWVMQPITFVGALMHVIFHSLVKNTLFVSAGAIICKTGKTKVRQLCDKYNSVLIFDEIQSGMGRSGKFFAYENFGIKPDVVTLAKGLAGGVPIGAFIATDKVAAAFHAGDHGSTFGGNPLACAAANVVLDIVGQTNFLQHVVEMGDYMKSRLEAMQAKYPALIKEVRCFSCFCL